MPTRDGFSDKLVLEALASTAISTDTTTVGNIIDTADFDMGVAFFVDVTAYTDGTYTIFLEESDDSGMSGAVTVADEKFIPETGPVAITAATVAGFAGNGVFSTLRFIRFNIVSTSTSTGATMNAIVVEQGEYNPQ